MIPGPFTPRHVGWHRWFSWAAVGLELVEVTCLASRSPEFLAAPMRLQ